ncbi:MAG: YkgJ family cysteine cluster protein [Amphritea sp.]|nr:YkgJ family cysteine cluster protein [Amphritea sp.]
MECRSGCAACCIAPQIATPIPGMPYGKPAGEPCINLDDQLNCRIWNQPDYPPLCRAFMPDAEHCGDDRVQALKIITDLEHATLPD